MIVARTGAKHLCHSALTMAAQCWLSLAQLDPKLTISAQLAVRKHLRKGGRLSIWHPSPTVLTVASRSSARCQRTIQPMMHLASGTVLSTMTQWIDHKFQLLATSARLRTDGRARRTSELSTVKLHCLAKKHPTYPTTFIEIHPIHPIPTSSARELISQSSLVTSLSTSFEIPNENEKERRKIAQVSLYHD